MLKDLEKINIEKRMKDWAADCLKRNAYPILLIAMPQNGKGDDLVIFRGGQYTVHQIRQLLLCMAERLQDADAPNVFG